MLLNITMKTHNENVLNFATMLVNVLFPWQVMKTVTLQTMMELGQPMHTRWLSS